MAATSVRAQRAYRASRKMVSIDISGETADAIRLHRTRTGLTTDQVIAEALRGSKQGLELVEPVLAAAGSEVITSKVRRPSRKHVAAGEPSTPPNVEGGAGRARGCQRTRKGAENDPTQAASMAEAHPIEPAHPSPGDMVADQVAQAPPAAAASRKAAFDRSPGESGRKERAAKDPVAVARRAKRKTASIKAMTQRKATQEKVASASPGDVEPSPHRLSKGVRPVTTVRQQKAPVKKPNGQTSFHF